MRFAVLVLALVLSVPAGATSTFIPDYYRGRNKGPDTLAGIGWNTDRDVGVQVGKRVSETKNNTATLDESRTLSALGLLAYRFPQNYTVQATLVRGLVEDKDPTLAAGTPDDRLAIRMAQLSFGYEAQDMPFAMGASYAKTKFDILDAGGTTVFDYQQEMRMFSVGGAFRLANQMYIGAGMSHFNNSYSAKSLALPSGSSYREIILGLGKVFGDLKKPDAAGELLYNYHSDDGIKTYSFGLKGLWNRGPAQYFAEYNNEQSDGDDEDRSWDLAVGFDYQISDYFFSPQFKHAREQDNGGTDSRTKGNEASIMIGYRIPLIELFVEASNEKETETFAGGVTAERETESKAITLGGYYCF